MKKEVHKKDDPWRSLCPRRIGESRRTRKMAQEAVRGGDVPGQSRTGFCPINKMRGMRFPDEAAGLSCVVQCVASLEAKESVQCRVPRASRAKTCLEPDWGTYN